MLMALNSIHMHMDKIKKQLIVEFVSMVVAMMRMSMTFMVAW